MKKLSLLRTHHLSIQNFFLARFDSETFGMPGMTGHFPVTFGAYLL